LLRSLPQEQDTGKTLTLMPALRHLVVVLGDQLNRDASAWDGFDPTQDGVWMCEARDESTHVLSAKQRITVFLSAMRHFAQALREEGLTLAYREMAAVTLAQALAETLATVAVQRIVVTQPGEWRVLQALRATALAAGVPLDVREDRHFLCSDAEFAAHARGRKQLRMEYFYREMRKRHAVLMDGEKPAGGEWNYDAENRSGFGANGPGFVPPPTRFAPDAITQSVIDLVNTQFDQHPGNLDRYGWPATREQALQVLDAFIRERLPQFGLWQDAMWEGQPWLYHAHISVALNLKLLDPREVIAAAQAEYRAGRVPLAGAEGFIRQILGWREYVRGIYRLGMPDYAQRNELAAHAALPDWYWNGNVPMSCLHDAITQTLQHGYAHHIQRLMVTGLYALLLGVEPKQVHAWYLGVYVDAVEWVELPNTLGMSQYADGGVMASKPYVATGKYIERMSDHCRACRFKPALRTGPQACPYTTLYWDFLMRHETRFARHPRMALQIKNLARIEPAERQAIGRRAAALQRGDWDAEC
jgi:deoxyribodipyrimidine photolyase-related protein